MGWCQRFVFRIKLNEVIYLTHLICWLEYNNMQKKMIIAFLSLMKPCPKLHHNVPLDAIGLLLFFLHVYVLPLPKMASPWENTSHFFRTPPSAGWAHWQSLQILVESVHMSLFPCKLPKDHASSLCFLVSFSGSLLLWGARWTFSCFLSVSFSCSSTCRSVAWVCHKDEFIPEEKLPPSKKVFHFRSLHMKIRNPESHFLGMLSWDFFVGGRGKQGQEILMPKGQIG